MDYLINEWVNHEVSGPRNAEGSVNENPNKNKQTNKTSVSLYRTFVVPSKDKCWDWRRNVKLVWTYWVWCRAVYSMWIYPSGHWNVGLELWERLGLQIYRYWEKKNQKYDARNFKALHRAFHITSKMKAGPSPSKVDCALHWIFRTSLSYMLISRSVFFVLFCFWVFGVVFFSTHVKVQ